LKADKRDPQPKMNPNNDGDLVFSIFINLQNQGVKICTEVHFESAKLGPDHSKLLSI
jgi:hypothetical protein